MEILPQLSFDQYTLVLNALNLTTAFMGGAALLFVLLRSQVGKAYRFALGVMAAAVLMAAYHYTQLLGNWRAAYAVDGGAYQPTGAPYQEAFRYADWLGTVPLILAALMLVLDLGRRKSNSLISRLAVAAVLMIGLGYVGEVARDTSGRALWGLLSCLPFFYILFVLWHEMRGVLGFETPRVRDLFSKLRLLLVASWTLHPVVYAFPLLGLTGASALVASQVGHSIADISAKVFYGLMIYAIAREKTLSEELLTAPAGDEVPAPSLAPAAAD